MIERELYVSLEIKSYERYIEYDLFFFMLNIIKGKLYLFSMYNQTKVLQIWLLVKLLFFSCFYLFVFTWWFSFLIWPRHDSQQAVKLCQCPTNAAQNEPIMNIFSLFLSVCPNFMHTVCFDKMDRSFLSNNIIYILSFSC